MPKLKINGVEVEVEKGTTLLEAARFLGFPIPSICHNDGLTPYGACRLCVVDLGRGPGAKMVSSCTYPAEDGLEVFTHTKRVVETRKMLIEMYLATCPTSKVIQDLASRYEATQVRFEPRNDNCILCGLCVRMCEEQMMAKAIGFVSRGEKRGITTAFDIRSDTCRLCGACMYICPACQMRCPATTIDSPICNACVNASPPCVEVYEHAMCYMDPCVRCVTETEAETVAAGKAAGAHADK
jgi:bidirectional [NiFe] hydrogenase diaphorase subunit